MLNKAVRSEWWDEETWWINTLIYSRCHASSTHPGFFTSAGLSLAIFELHAHLLVMVWQWTEMTLLPLCSSKGNPDRICGVASESGLLVIGMACKRSLRGWLNGGFKPTPVHQCIHTLFGHINMCGWGTQRWWRLWRSGQQPNLSKLQFYACGIIVHAWKHSRRPEPNPDWY